jgi:hypothetical protein
MSLKKQNTVVPQIKATQPTANKPSSKSLSTTKPEEKKLNINNVFLDDAKVDGGQTVYSDADSFRGMQGERVQVAVRCRPLMQHEKNHSNVITI